MVCFFVKVVRVKGLELSTRALRSLDELRKLFRRGAIFSMADRHRFVCETENCGEILCNQLMVICMFFSSCAQVAEPVADVIRDNASENKIFDANTVTPTVNGENNDFAENLSVSNQNNAIPEVGTYNEGVALVKYDGEMNDNVLSQLNLVSATALYSGSSWYTVELKADADTVETVTYLRELGCFEKVDYDYIMGTTGPKEDAEKNPNYDDQVTLRE